MASNPQQLERMRSGGGIHRGTRPERWQHTQGALVVRHCRVGVLR